ncbi:hypothetical protein RFI_25526, partial [Reticulomyxa filosa]
KKRKFEKKKKIKKKENWKKKKRKTFKNDKWKKGRGMENEKCAIAHRRDLSTKAESHTPSSRGRIGEVKFVVKTFFGKRDEVIVWSWPNECPVQDDDIVGLENGDACIVKWIGKVSFLAGEVIVNGLVKAIQIITM